jgi:hypothetical protein
MITISKRNYRVNDIIGFLYFREFQKQPVFDRKVGVGAAKLQFPAALEYTRPKTSKIGSLTAIHVTILPELPRHTRVPQNEH